jgi:hypothetical protein
MTKQEVEIQIKEFLNILVYEAQFLAFKNKLLKNNKNIEVQKFIIFELEKISKHIVNGKFKTVNKVKNTPKTKVKSKKDNNLSDVKKSKVIKDPPHVFLDYKKYTYLSLSKEINTPISVFETLLKQKNYFASIKPGEKISVNTWIILQQFVQNKYKIIMSARRKSDSDKIKITNRKFRSTTPDQYRGGNFGKIIYIGKTS